ncbi:hypothetical protein DPMN_040485 [Dreissena polymorpha]|uniref:Uncharacterized protein n=1 Tax=Dreissena polymorpha TaxID=45954 RepID=A0A9D4CXW5_DREPO|nr:hypothetical protein DPMN_040485 [Dreissena polymorpha]
MFQYKEALTSRDHRGCVCGNKYYGAGVSVEFTDDFHHHFVNFEPSQNLQQTIKAHSVFLNLDSAVEDMFKCASLSSEFIMSFCQQFIGLSFQLVENDAL